MNTILFLDIDGVLNDSRFLHDSSNGEGVVIVNNQFDASAHIDPARVARLNRILEATGAHVVLSTSWRALFGIERTEAFLRSRGFDGTIIDQTPRLKGHERHVEIRRWLSAQATEPDRFAIVDDDLDAGYGFGHRFVGVVDGIEDEHVERLIALLGRRAAPTPGAAPQGAGGVARTGDDDGR